MAIKNYSISGVAPIVEFGKRGSKINATAANVITFTDASGNLQNLSIANATQDAHAITYAQLQKTGDEAQQFYKVQVNYNSGTVQLANLTKDNTRILGVRVEVDSAWTGSAGDAAIEVGDATDPDRLFSGDYIDCTTPGTYLSDFEYTYATGPNVINVVVTQGGATGGTANVIMTTAFVPA